MKAGIADNARVELQITREHNPSGSDDEDIKEMLGAGLSLSHQDDLL